MNFAETPVGARLSPLGFVPLMSIRRVGRTGEQRSVDDDNDSFFIRVNDDQQHPLGWAPAGITAGGAGSTPRRDPRCNLWPRRKILHRYSIIETVESGAR